MSQETVARRLNVSHQTYARYERGETKVSLERLYEIAGALEVSVDELFDGKVAA